MTITLEMDARLVYETICGGGLAVLPTDIGYGLVAMKEPAVRRVYELKGRPLTKPCVTVVDAQSFDDVTLPITADVRAWIADVTTRTPLAVVADFDPASRLLAKMDPYVRSQSTQAGTIATFHSAGRLIQRVAELALADGALIVGSSANLAGTGNNYTFADVPETMRLEADLVLDRGPAWYANDQRCATTILDLRSGTFLRRGINFAQIERSWTSFVAAAAAAAA